MRSITEQILAQRFLERYASRDVSVDRNVAMDNLKKLGVLNDDGSISEKYKDLIIDLKRDGY
jgi:hypothetical protein